MDSGGLVQLVKPVRLSGEVQQITHRGETPSCSPRIQRYRLRKTSGEKTILSEIVITHSGSRLKGSTSKVNKMPFLHKTADCCSAILRNFVCTGMLVTGSMRFDINHGHCSPQRSLGFGFRHRSASIWQEYPKVDLFF